jgi:hypothetical protein
MQAASLPPTAGWLWARDGFRLFMRQPLALFAWALAISLLVLFARFASPPGLLIFIVLMPAVTLMTMSACKHVDADRTMLPSMWVKPLQKPGVMRKLLLMGLMYAGFCIGAGIVSFLPFAGDLSEAVTAASVTHDVTPFFLALRGPLMVFVVLYVTIAAMFWHAPVLVAWHNLRLGQALFFSGVACWRNKWAFLIYGLTWAAVFLGIDFCAGVLVQVGLPQELIDTLRIPVNIAAGGMLYSSFYPTYTSVFEGDNASFELDSGHGTQA